MHVLVLPSWYRTPECPWSGIFFENHAVALARAGARVGVAFVERRSLRSLSPANVGESHFQVARSEERGVTALRLKGWNTLGQTLPGAKIWAVMSERLVRTYVQRFGVPDVLHAHAALWAGTVAVRMGRILSRPSVVTEHSSLVLRGDLEPRERREAARVYCEADQILAVSEPLLAAVGSVAGGRRGRVVPNAVDCEFFTRPPVARRQSPFTFLSACNLVAGKRLDHLIRAFATASQIRSDLRVVIVGAGPEEGALRRLAQACGVAPLVTFAGGLPPEGVRERMWNANALVLSSAAETFGVVVVEALATGIPVISTRCGGPEDIVEPGLGLLVNRDDEEGLAKAMLDIAGQSYSEGALRDRMMARYSFEKVARDLLSVYGTLAARGRW